METLGRLERLDGLEVNIDPQSNLGLVAYSHLNTDHDIEIWGVRIVDTDSSEEDIMFTQYEQKSNLVEDYLESMQFLGWKPVSTISQGIKPEWPNLKPGVILKVRLEK